MVYIEPCNSLSRKRPCSKSIPKNAIVSLFMATQPLRKDKGSSLYPLLLTVHSPFGTAVILGPLRQQGSQARRRPKGSDGVDSPSSEAT